MGKLKKSRFSKKQIGMLRNPTVMFALYYLFKIVFVGSHASNYLFIGLKILGRNDDSNNLVLCNSSEYLDRHKYSDNATKYDFNQCYYKENWIIKFQIGVQKILWFLIHVCLPIRTRHVEFLWIFHLYGVSYIIVMTHFNGLALIFYM